MNPDNNLAVFHNLAADLNDRLNQISGRIRAYNEMTFLSAGLTYASDFSEASRPSLDELSGVQFEEWCCRLLENRGYEEITMTPASHDFGADILAKKDGVRYAIQCKRYKGTVGEDAIKDAHSAKDHYRCNVAAVMTSSTFTSAAKKLAATNCVVLWDRSVIEDWIETL